ncbi:unnamed protein product [Leuciscus chuanchicus]
MELVLFSFATVTAIHLASCWDWHHNNGHKELLTDSEYQHTMLDSSPTLPSTTCLDLLGVSPYFPCSSSHSIRCIYVHVSTVAFTHAVAAASRQMADIKRKSHVTSLNRTAEIEQEDNSVNSCLIPDLHVYSVTCGGYCDRAAAAGGFRLCFSPRSCSGGLILIPFSSHILCDPKLQESGAQGLSGHKGEHLSADICVSVYLTVSVYQSRFHREKDLFLAEPVLRKDKRALYLPPLLQ